MKRTVLLFAGLILLPGCESIPKYSSPQNTDDAAKVRFASNGLEEGYTGILGQVSSYRVHMFDDAQCSNEQDVAFLASGGVSFVQNKSLDMPLNDFGKANSKEVYMKSDAQKYLMFVGSATSPGPVSKTTYGCGLMFPFTPSKDGLHEFLFIHEHFDKCSVQSSEIGFDSANQPVRQNQTIIEKEDISDTCARAFRKLY